MPNDAAPWAPWKYHGAAGDAVRGADGNTPVRLIAGVLRLARVTARLNWGVRRLSAGVGGSWSWRPV